MKTRYLIACLLLLAACAKSSEKNILGKWKNNQGIVFEFIKDGTVIVNGNASTYSFIGKDRIRVQGFLGNEVFTVFFPDDDTLVIGDANGKKDKNGMKRVKE